MVRVRVRGSREGGVRERGSEWLGLGSGLGLGERVELGKELLRG